MLVVGIGVIALIAIVAILRMGLTRVRASVTLIAFGLALPALGLAAPSAGAADVVNVQLATASGYSVLGATTVTNTGDSVLAGSVGLSPGTSVTGFPPGKVTPPAIIDTSPTADQAQLDLTDAYVDAAGRSITATTTADLAGLNLSPGVYSGPKKAALELNGTLTLDAANNPDAVFIFQTDSMLNTGTGSTVSLINGAQACHVFWQVGSSAILGANSLFVGTVLAHTSVTVNKDVTVHGRALARTGAVTLDNDTFTDASCTQTGTTTTTEPGSTTTSTAADSTTTTPGSGSTTTTDPGGSTTTTPGSATTTTAAASPTTPPGSGSTTTTDPGGSTTTTPGSGSTTTTNPGGSTTKTPGNSSTTIPTGLVTQNQPSGPSTTTGTGMTGGTHPSGGPGSPGITTQELARTGSHTTPLVLLGGLMVAIGLATLLVGRDRNLQR